MSHAKDTTLLCYRTACAAPAHPCGYNRVTHGLYCLACAVAINQNTPPGQEDFYPLLPYVNVDISGGSYRAGVVMVRGFSGRGAGSAQGVESMETATAMSNATPRQIAIAARRMLGRPARKDYWLDWDAIAAVRIAARNAGYEPVGCWANSGRSLTRLAADYIAREAEAYGRGE